MKQLTFTVKDELGVHARPAGLFVKEAAKFSSHISIEKAGKVIDAKKIFALMALNVKCGEEVTIEIDGTDEESAMASIQELVANCW